MHFLWRNSRIKLSGGLLFWREIGGNSNNVVFLHGSWYNSSQWLPVMERLSLDYHCFAPDLPGFGESEFSSTHYSINQIVESLAEYIATLKLEKVYLVAHSLGGWIAASYALKYSEQLLGVILISPEGINLAAVKARWRLFRFLIQKPSFLCWVLQLIYPFVRLLGAHTKIKNILQFRQKLLLSSTGTKILFRRRWTEIQAELLTAELAFLKVKTLILQGYKDTKIALSMSKFYADLLPMAKLHLINSGGDNLPEQMPDIVVEKITDFLSDGDNF
ncbi:MAG: alpha/beta hydrolase [Okeania sp. SIO2G4]|nr:MULTISPECIES: alpha/beta hydrolase [unclassified Okeania]NEP04421.1 alpha/beta hydrolase [Okeania sp. SIO4D6]NEP39892.1 alpha/beta hydrolase [Okeania sp. SIO2H7]NEP95244.1 alpha/beta hydrolase [Okeania sp. SIO2F5]NEP75490.1 alpha/beta hydrolase [Okeania sp. SIO2G5]NEQ93743.1 alpha/beta hydrolase [Okeania sp. SIO2G4]